MEFDNEASMRVTNQMNRMNKQSQVVIPTALLKPALSKHMVSGLTDIRTGSDLCSDTVIS